MKILIHIFVLICLLMLPVPIWAGPEEDAIRKIIADEAKAWTDFPRIRDIQAVLKFYAPDYTGIADGLEVNLKSAEDMLSDLKEQLDLGDKVGISSKVSNVKLQISGTTAWATFDHDLKIGKEGEVIAQEQGMCTGIYKKKGTQWLIQHEHCSTPRLTDSEEGTPE